VGWRVGIQDGEGDVDHLPHGLAEDGHAFLRLARRRRLIYISPGKDKPTFKPPPQSGKIRAFHFRAAPESPTLKRMRNPE